MELGIRFVSFRELQKEETQENNFDMANLFHSASSSMLKYAEIESIESQPSARWALPSIRPSEVYGDLSMFHLKAITRVTVKECVSQI